MEDKQGADGYHPGGGEEGAVTSQVQIVVEAATPDGSTEPEVPQEQETTPLVTETDGAGDQAQPQPLRVERLLSETASQTSRASSQKPLEMCVFLMNKTGVKFVVEDGTHAPAADIFDMVVDELDMPDEACDAFCLWLTSPLLELQLKPNHIPFRLSQRWEDLLMKYTTASKEDLERDEPVLTLQRNVFYPKSEEMRLNEEKILGLLYHEGVYNITAGRYPCEEEEYDMLASMQLLIQLGHYDPEEHTAEFYRNEAYSFYPDHMDKKGWSLPGFRRNTIEHRLKEQHIVGTKKYADVPVEELQRKYLSFCWQLPCYGCAYFSGQIEHPRGIMGMFSSVHDDNAYVAVNTDGIFILDVDHVTLLLGLSFKEFSWTCAEPKGPKDAQKSLPCLLIQFDDTENDEPVKKVLQIFSKEAVLVDGLLNACHMVYSNLQQAAAGADCDCVDGTNTDYFVKMKEASGTAALGNKLNKLCLASYNHKGECVSDSRCRPSK